MGEQKGLTKEGNEATYLLWYWRFSSLQTAGDMHQSVLQIITSTLLHACSNRVFLSQNQHAFLWSTAACLMVEYERLAELKLGDSLPVDDPQCWPKVRGWCMIEAVDGWRSPAYCTSCRNSSASVNCGCVFQDWVWKSRPQTVLGEGTCLDRTARNLESLTSEHHFVLLCEAHYCWNHITKQLLPFSRGKRMTGA